MGAYQGMELHEADKQFLSRLQDAVRRADRSSILKLVGIPLRVNSQGTTRLYRDKVSVERDFERIFTARVSRAILKQVPDELFVRDQGVMIGDGEVWFGRSCPNRACSPAGPLLIEAINP